MSKRKRLRAVVEVDRDEQIEELVRLASNAEVGLQVFEDEDDAVLGFVTVVDVSEREDGIFVFGERVDAEHFAAIINEAAGGDEHNPAFVDEQSINVGAGAEMLIAAARAEAVEALGYEESAEEVRALTPRSAMCLPICSHVAPARRS